MKRMSVVRVIVIALFVISCKDQEKKENNGLLIGKGRMPAIAGDNNNSFFVVYGSGDSLLFSSSSDGSKTFSSPALIAVLPGLTASAMRGPQIASVANGLVVIACNKAGNIFSYTKDEPGKWSPAVRVNDVDTVAKEQFLALSAAGNNAFAVWLDLRDNKRNKIVGAKSTDGGKNWSKNIIVYASPDTTVCECCKPAVALRGENIFVMFRNWLNGSRDMYVITSSGAGKSFGDARKLGIDSWVLNGCPMDGGGIVINNNGVPETVWRRKDSIYTCQPGLPESAIGAGRGCTIESVNGKNVYAWTEKGEVIIRKPRGMKINLGKGQLPLIRRINNEHILCVWENDKQIHSAIVSL